MFNPLAHETTGLVTAQVGNARVTGAAIQERGANGEVSFLAEKVPAFGYRVYEVAGGVALEQAAPDLVVGPSSLENSDYKLEFDGRTGAVRRGDARHNFIEIRSLGVGVCALDTRLRSHP